MSNPQGKTYDLSDRTARLGANIITFSKNIPLNVVTESLVRQLVRSATSVGANYAEADEAASRKDFIYKLCIAKKESRETQHGLRMISIAHPKSRSEARVLFQEAKELTLIFNAIIRKTKGH